MSAALLVPYSAITPLGTVPIPRQPGPKPAGLRPKKHDNPFPVLNLFRLPARVFRPPKTTGMVGSVRSFKSTPFNDVKLADVLAGKHLSPLSLKDFEGHLVFREYSAENLYFILWLNQYEKEYDIYMNDTSVTKKQPTPNLNTDPAAARSASHLPDALAESLQRGLDAFFRPNGSLELNLSSATREKTLVEAGNSGNPADFAIAREVIEHSLDRSLVIHARNSTANAGPRRLVFCFCLGLSVFCLGLIPPFVGIFGDHARAWRLIGLPFIWFGTAVMVMALKRICGVIWLLGEDRQLLPWELASPTVTSGSLVALSGPSTPRSDASWDEESLYGEDSKTPDQSFQTATSANPYPWEKQQQQQQQQQHQDEVDLHVTTHALEGASPHQSSSRPPSYSSKSPPKGVVPHSAPVWGPCTSVFSPDVAKAQWSIAIFSFLCGVLALCTVGVVLMAVPNQS